MKFIATSTVSLVEINKKNDQIAQVTSAMDWLIRDVQTVNSDYDYLTSKENTLKISRDSERITWKMNDEKLVRNVQRYDNTLHRWKKSYTAIVVHPVSNLLFEILFADRKSGNSGIAGVRCTFSCLITEKQRYRISQTIALRNGRL